MSVERIASRYAKSLLELAIEKGELDTVNADMTFFNKVSENKDFVRMLKSPIITRDKKQNVFDAIFKGKISKLTESYFDLIIKKGREVQLDSIAREFTAQYKVHNKITSVTLTTATEVGQSVIDKIMGELNSSSSTDKNIELTTKINPALIGGYILEFDNKLYDSSVAHKLELLKKEFSKNEYIKNL